MSMSMSMSTKGRLAVSAMIDLALREPAGPVSLATIGVRQRVSMSYLEQLFSQLRSQGLVVSARGPGGGYTLGRAAEAISVADIVAAVESRPAAAEATAGAGSLVHELGLRLEATMREHMGRITLRSLVQEQLARGLVVEARPARRTSTSWPAPKPVRTNAPNSVFAFGRSFAR